MPLLQVLKQAEKLIIQLVDKVNKSQMDWLEIEKEILRFSNHFSSLIEQEVLDKIEEPSYENKTMRDGKLYRYSENRNLSFINRFGEKITRSRRCYKTSERCIGFLNPLDEKLGFKHQGFSPLMTYLQALFGSNESYNVSSQLLTESLGFQVSSTAVQSNTEHVGSLIPKEPHEFLEIEMQSEQCELMIVEVDGTTSPQIRDNPEKKGLESLKEPTEYKECNTNQKLGKNRAEKWRGILYELISDMKKALRYISKVNQRSAGREINYFESNKERMKYLDYRNRGFPIGSGMIEATCKLVVCKRFKGNGMRWKKEDNSQVLRSRLAFLNGKLQDYFSGEQKRWAA